MKTLDQLKGYTLVEIIVVVASTGLIMVAVIGIILGSFKAQNRNTSNKKNMESGSSIMNKLRENIFNSSGENIICASDSLSVGLKSMLDGGTTTLSCDQITNKIASTSATKQDVLNTNDVTVTDCSKFVTCENNSDGDVSGVVFNFGLSAVTNGVGTSQTFTNRVTLRN